MSMIRMVMRVKRDPSPRALTLTMSPSLHHHPHLTHHPLLRPAGLLLRGTCRFTLLSSNPSPPSNWRSQVFEKDTVVYVMTSIISLDK